MYPSYSARAVCSASLKHPILDERRERELLCSAKLGDREAVGELVVFNQRLVATIAKKYNRIQTPTDIEFEDLVQAGNMGLCQAIRMWDASKKVKFSTYAYYWIRAYVRRLSLKKASALSLSFGYSEKLAQIRRVKSDFLEKEQREPTWIEIAGLTGIPLEEVMLSRLAMESGGSMDDTYHDPMNGDEASESIWQVADIEQDTEDDAISLVMLSQVRKVVDCLPDHWKRIIVLRYGLDGNGGKTQVEIGDMFGVSRQSIEQTEKQALRFLRVRMAGKDQLVS